MKIHTRILAPIDLGGGPGDAADPDFVEAAHQRVVAAMQGAMNDLARLGRHGLFPRG